MISRREALRSFGTGFGMLGFAGLLQETGLAGGALEVKRLISRPRRSTSFFYI